MDIRARYVLWDTWVAMAILILVAIFYGSTLKNGFIHDDHGQVETNTYIHSLMYLPKILTGCIWESAVGNCKETYYYRPLQSLSYLATYQLSSEPWVFHVVNLVYFSAAVFLTYVLVTLLTENVWLGVLTALIFLIHPLNTEVVNWVAAVPELLYTIGVLVATIYYILYRKKKNAAHQIGVYIAYALAIFAKEPAVFLPFIFVTLDFVYFHTTITSFMRWKHLKIYVYCCSIFAVYMALRFWVLGGLGSDPTTTQTLFQHISIFFDLFGKYLSKLFWPYPLNLFYPYHPQYGVSDAHFLVGIGLFVLYIGFLIVSWVRRWRMVVVALVWYGIFLAPSLLFTSSIGENLFAERHVFASTIGFALLVAMLFQYFWKQGQWQKVALSMLGLVVVIGSLGVIYQRNTLWQSDETIYADTLTKSPDADLIRYNLAYLYEEAGKTDLAKVQYNVIVERGVWRGLGKVYNNLGNMTRKAGDLSSAEDYFKRAIAFDPVHVESFSNLGAMNFEQGNFIQSLAYLCKANQINPTFQNANDNLDHLVQTVQSMDLSTFTSLFKKLTGSPELALQNQDCLSGDACLLTFRPDMTSQNYPLSFLIAGQTSKGTLIRPRRVGTKQSTGELILDIDKKWAKDRLHFFFPTCESVFRSSVEDR